MTKKCISFILAITTSILMCSVSFADYVNEENSAEYTEYLSYVDAGILSHDISFEYWKELKSSSLELEKSLSASNEFTLVYDSLDANSTYSTYTMTKGDVIITSGTSSGGILGHSGIVITSRAILHIAGSGYNPATISLEKWNSTYTTEGWTKIYRHSDADIATDAADWASDTYKGSSAEYVISMDLTSTNETYCSKLVWQAYYYGPSEPCANGPTWGVRMPYDLPTTIHDLTLIQTYEET